VSAPAAPRREYPDAPRVGVGAVVLDGDAVLLVRRGGQPSAGKWSLPGGLVELGETTVEAVCREVAEECGIAVRVAGVAGVLDRVVRDAEGRVRYHWVLVDYLAYPESLATTAASDAAEARWVPIAEVERLDITDGLLDMILRAAALGRGASP
jgi:8-oxo-dGTP diphosphatase